VVKKFVSILLLLLLLSCVIPAIQAIPLSYNLKVRRVFNVEPVIKQKKRLLVSAVPIYYSRTSHIVDQTFAVDTCEDRHIFGSLFNLRYVASKNLWLEVTTGIERDHGEYKGTPTFEHSSVGIDDIVLAAGGRAFMGEKIQLVGYGVLGIPAKTDISLCDRFGPFVGTRIYSVGIGGEVSYSFFDSLQRSFAAIAQGRILHGFERSWDPILPTGGQIQPGNVTDLLLALQYREGLTSVEAGYNATVFSDQALILPQEKIKSCVFTRNSWYATLSRANLKSFFDKPLVYGIGVNVSRAHKFDAKTFTGWLYFTFVF
jgi:hypothetical protein